MCVTDPPLGGLSVPYLHELGVRTVMPAAAGVAGLRYVWFATASVAGPLVWATAWVSAGRMVRALGALVGPDGPVLIVVLGSVVLGVGLWRRRRSRRRESLPSITAGSTPPIAARRRWCAGDIP